MAVASECRRQQQALVQDEIGHLSIGWICLWSTLVPKPTNLSSFNQTREAYQGTLPGPKNKAKTLRESKKGARLLQAKNLLLVPFVLEASANAFQRLGGAIPNGTRTFPSASSGACEVDNGLSPLGLLHQSVMIIIIIP
ncbi:conserved hypothetical protein [Histoplasma capsulatum var. duboisii H88]|uniref:Uncharacterized protein n=2 Tax=Ajellomyces capsulatus TaxID=5037 RepID=F0U9E0_AJEC8|nr:conserved hypothetical protein [Histoplasma capsulatum H143]EGC41882.1 conserved hypothetical protein [Histoplasma capsulatum var. duboisii H88]